MNIARIVFSILSLAICLGIISVKGVEISDGGDPKHPDRKVLKAGAAAIDITGTVPPGYTVHDSLYARTLVLDNGESRLVFIVADKQSMPQEVVDAIKELILSEQKIEAKNITISPTHTHSATSTTLEGNSPSGFPQRYSWNQNLPLQPHQIALVRQITDGVKSAIANLKPARIGWGSGKVAWSFNRRWIMKEPVVDPYGGFDRVTFHPGVLNKNKIKPAGPVDQEVFCISVQALDGNPIAIFANFSSHHAGGVPKNHISADYFGVFSKKIEELVKTDHQAPPFVGILSNGTSGDLSPTNYHGGQPSYGNYERMKAMGEAIAHEVQRVYDNLKYRDWVPLSSVQTELSLDVLRASEDILDHARKVLARPAESPQRHSRERLQARYLMQMENEWPDRISVVLQVSKIGDLAICTAPFEVFAETGLDLKNRSPFDGTFTIGLANGHHGYLPTAEQHELGGYETYIGSCRVQKESSALVTDRLLDMLNTLQN